MIPPHSGNSGTICISLPPDAHQCLSGLPWHAPLDTWQDHGVLLIPVKCGISRHVVRFVENQGRRFAIKETTSDSAMRELASYELLLRRNIPTIIPTGIVVRDDGKDVVHTSIGKQPESRVTGYLVTEVMENVVPDSLLFKRGFSTGNRRRIWDAVIRLFVELHSNGVYWGDASLANMLIHFRTESVPHLGPRTTLRAILADAETLEIHPTISDRLRLADVEFFLESMLWTEADLQASGVLRDPLVTLDDQRYLLQQYMEQYAINLEMQSFELVTRIDVDRLLGNFDVKGYGKLLLQHIQEHKWYLSERLGKEIPLTEAASDWYRTIFKPVCRIFTDYGLPDHVPDKTASSLYVEIMEHKYFMSQGQRRDVGLVAALEDYSKTFGEPEPLNGTLDSIVKALTMLFQNPKAALYKDFLT